MADTVITFDLQDGWTSQPSVTVPSGHTSRLDMVQIPHRDWYKFDGYFTDPTQGDEWWFDETGRSRTDSWPYQSWQGGNVTLYARWTAVTPEGETRRTVTLNKDGGSGGTAGPLDAYSGYTLPWVQIPTKHIANTPYDYVFLGYFRKISNTNYVKLIDGFGGPVANYPVDANLTLYARWGLPTDTFTITFDTQDGFILAPEERTRTYTVCQTYSAQGGLSPTKTKSVGGGGSMAGPSVPRWGGLRGMSWGSFAGDNYGVATPGSTRASPWGTLAQMSFLGWFTEPVGGTQVLDSDHCTLTSDITLYAHWRIATLSLEFDAQGGLFADGTSKRIVDFFLAYGRSFGAFPTPTRQGYVFAGWYTLPQDMSLQEYATSQGADPNTLWPEVDIPRGGVLAVDSDCYAITNPNSNEVQYAAQRGFMIEAKKGSSYIDLCIGELGMVIPSQVNYDRKLISPYSAPLFAHWTQQTSHAWRRLVFYAFAVLFLLLPPIAQSPRLTGLGGVVKREKSETVAAQAGRALRMGFCW